MISVREATPGDAAAVAHVHVRAWQIAYRGLLPQAHLDGLRPEERMGRYSFGDTGPGRPETIVATTGTVRGFATIGAGRDGSEAGEVYALYVDPSVWGVGIGRALVLEARARLRRHGYGDAFLWVLAANDRARRFYDADGWRPDGHRRVERIGGASVTEVRYHRRLS